MEICCDLEVDINGEEIFVVDKKTLASFSGRLRNLFSKLISTRSHLKLIFQDFPGGAEGFELIARFCYNNGRNEITPSNLVLLNCAAHFMKMDIDVSGRPNLIHQTEKSLEGISFWTWPELLLALKQCQDLIRAWNSSFVLQKVLNCLGERLASHSDENTYTSSSDNSNLKFSCDSRSIDSMKDNCSQTAWWFEDLMFLNIGFIDKVIRTLISQKFDNVTIIKFLFYYQKSRFLGAMPAEKREIMEVVISLLSLLDRSFLSCKLLFEIFRVALSLKITKPYKNKLESLIGSKLDQVTLDYLLVPSGRGKAYTYDVNLVLRFVKAFLEGNCELSPIRLKKVARLIDSYLVEVAPDSHLKPSRFAALLKALPDCARDCHDRIYQAMDIYLEVHAGLCEEEKMRVCWSLNYEKLSKEALKQLVQNSKFPSRTAAKALIAHQFKLKSLLQDNHLLKIFHDSMFCKTSKEILDKKWESDKLLYAKKLDSLTETEAEKLRTQLQGMQWRVKELEKDCNVMQTQMKNKMKSKLSSQANARYLPRLCL